MGYFKIDESPVHPGKFLIRPDFDKLPLHGTSGSYNVLMARIMGVSFADYLRLCRDEYGAEVTGKNSMYPVPYFTKDSGVKELIKELDKRVVELLKN